MFRSEHLQTGTVYYMFGSDILQNGNGLLHVPIRTPQNGNRLAGCGSAGPPNKSDLDNVQVRCINDSHASPRHGEDTLLHDLKIEHSDPKSHPGGESLMKEAAFTLKTQQKMGYPERRESTLRLTKLRGRG